MKKAALFIAVSAALFAAPAVQAKPRLTPEQRLDKILAGRVAGKPVSCISNFDSRDVQVIDKTAIVYDSGSVIYVNRTSNPKSLRSDDIMVTKLWGNQLCRLDTVHMHERSGGFWNGFVGLEDFVPYRKAPKEG